MRTVSLTMSLAGTLTLCCCVFFFWLFGKSFKAKWRRVLLIMALVFYALPLSRYKFILLRVGDLLHLIPDANAVSSDTMLPMNNAYRVFLDAAGRSSFSEVQTILNVINALLLMVAAGILLYHIGIHLFVQRAVRSHSQPAGEEITALLEEWKVGMGIRRRICLLQSDRVSVPVVSGVLLPVILLPTGMHAEDSAFKHMLLHELAHIKHQDILIQWAGLLVVALHWFNPFSYLLFHLLTEANEQYSDAEAVRALSEQEKRCYCETLIHYSEQAGFRDRRLVALGFSKNAKRQIRNRMEEILNKKPKRPGIALGAGVLVLLIGTATAFVYQPPLTIIESGSGAMKQELVLDPDVDVYFQFIDIQTDTEPSVPNQLQ